jgi:3-dehydrosphinganine reductase
MPKLEDFHGKRAVIFGGSEGIGKSLAKLILEAGGDVAICSRSEEKLRAATTEMERLRVRLISRPVDVTDFRAVQALAADLEKTWGTPDLLINCAGYARPGYLEELGIEHFRKMMELNYFGTVHTTKAFLPQMLKKRGSHILNTSSLAGFIGLFGYTGYCASKFAVVGFSEALRREIAPWGVNVSVLCPPNTRTPGLDEENKFKPKEVLATEEKVKVVDPDYVAAEALAGLKR